MHAPLTKPLVVAPGALAPQQGADALSRPCVRGKFLFAGDEKLYLRGVTYGPFRAEEDGSEYHTPEQVDHDFREMAATGVNAVRIYTVPPRWLLDIAQRHGLWVMVGLPWEQHITFLDDPARCADIEKRMREGVRSCVGHPAVFAYAIGNEIPSNIVRWHGHRKMERFLRRLFDAVKAEDAGALVTYVNYPSTEYLDLPFLDFACFNVYLETREKLNPYLARLQNIANDRPLVIGEVGLDSHRNGEAAQARAMEWQLRDMFSAGCAGLFVFAWTDEWHRGGCDIDDWDFGLNTRDRQPKLALEAVRRAFAEAPIEPDSSWPFVSVVVCTYNGGRTLQDTLEGLRRLQYPRYEVIVVDDGSTDNVAQIAGHYDVRLIRTPNRGLSNARNTGMLASRGEIVAYIDDDARADPEWLTYLAHTFRTSDHAAVGGPNIAPPGDGFFADCVAHAPGGPIHVLLTDTVAEHVPGCNMAFRKSALLEVGGFDPQFRIAGDDVDICWRIQQRGWTIGFSPAALVWHHRRNSLRTYLKQQKNYGRAEALLERKWPAKYNALGHPSWEGRVYASSRLPTLGWQTWRIYHGTWGSALFQSVYHTAPPSFMGLPSTPEWYLVIAVLAVLTATSPFAPALLFSIPMLIAAAALPLAQAIMCGVRAVPRSVNTDRLKRRRATVIAMHLLQPAARLFGRMRAGLNPWRFRRGGFRAFPRRRGWAAWSEQWEATTARLQRLEAVLRSHDAVTVRGGDWATWDLQVLGGVVGSARLKLTAEEHGSGRQMIRLRAWPKCSRAGRRMALTLGILAAVAGLCSAFLTCIVLAIAAAAILLLALDEMTVAMGVLVKVVDGGTHVTREPR